MSTTATLNDMPRPNARNSRLAAIGDRLKALREYKGWSQAEISHRCEISPTAWNNYELGLRQITVRNAFKVINTVEGVDLDFIYWGDVRYMPKQIVDRLPAKMR